MKIYYFTLILFFSVFVLKANADIRTASYVFYINVDAPADAMHEDDATAYWYTATEVDADTGAALSPAPILVRH
jgi:hypothetical protein